MYIKNTRYEGSTGLYAAFTDNTDNTVDMVYTVFFYWEGKVRKKGPIFRPLVPILRLTFLESLCNFQQYG